MLHKCVILTERSLVDEQLDAFSRSELALLMLSVDPRLSTSDLSLPPRIFNALCEELCTER